MVRTTLVTLVHAMSAAEAAVRSAPSILLVAAGVLAGCTALRSSKETTDAGRPIELGASAAASAPEPAASASSASVTSPVPNDGTDATQPMLPPADDGFADARGGAGWGDRCFVSIKSKHWGWAKAECDKAMAMSPASPQPRASLLFNEGLIAKQAGDVDGARADFTASLALRDNAAVKAALDSLPGAVAQSAPSATGRHLVRIPCPNGEPAQPNRAGCWCGGTQGPVDTWKMGPRPADPNCVPMFQAEGADCIWGCR